MASLSIKELSKRNNFNIFVKRIAIGQGFYLVGVDELILLDPSILAQIDDLDGLRYYEDKNSILLPTKDGGKVKLTSLYKDSEFSNRTDTRDSYIKTERAMLKVAKNTLINSTTMILLYIALLILTSDTPFYSISSFFLYSSIYS